MEWYDWRNVCQSLVTFGRAIQGVSPYTVVIEPDTGKCETGFCNFTTRRIAVNPKLFPDRTPKDQYALTKALLVHEAGHRRFTTPGEAKGVLHLVINILEDERIERLMSESFAGLRHLVTALSAAMYTNAQPLDATSESSGEVLAAILQARWAEKTGQSLKGSLSPKNQKLAEKVMPLARQAWIAPETATVEGIAREVVAILGLTEKAVPTWVVELQERLGGMDGERDGDDPAEGTDAAAGEHTDTEGETPERGFDALPSSAAAGLGEFAIEPKPYIALVDRVQPQVQELMEQLSLAHAATKPEPERRGSRLSLREALRNPNEPFIVEGDGGRKPLTMTFRVIIDHSTSMNLKEARHETRIEGVAEGAMMLHLFAAEANIDHEIVVTPNDVRIADLESGERGLALIAGLVPALTWWENLGKAIETHAYELMQQPEDVKILICAHDGYPNDGDVARAACKTYRGKVEVIGVGIDLDAGCAAEMHKIFGESRLILCRTPEELPRKLGILIRTIYGL
jgi:hypothetical protein